MTAIDIGIAVCHQHQDVRVGVEVAHDVAQEVDAARVGPVRIVDQRDERLGLGRALKDVDDRLEQQQSFRVGIRVGRTRSVGCAPSQLGHDAAELAAMTRHVFEDHVVADVGDDRAQKLSPRRERRGHVLVAATEHNERAFLVRLARELRCQAGLADSRLTREEHGGGAVDLRALPGFGEAKPFVFARRERELTTLAPQRRGQGSRRADGRGPRHFEGNDWIGQTLQIDFAHEHELEIGTTAGQPAHQIVTEDLATGGGIAKPSGGDNRGAVAIAVFPRDIARADPDPHFDTAVVARLAIRAVDPTLDLVRRVHGLCRRAERREDSVAQALDDRPAVLGDRGPEDLIVPTAEEIGLDVSEASAHLRTPNDVGVQDRRGTRPTLEHRAKVTGLKRVGSALP